MPNPEFAPLGNLAGGRNPAPLGVMDAAAPESTQAPPETPGPSGLRDRSAEGPASERASAVGEIDEALAAVEASRQAIIQLRYRDRPGESLGLRSQVAQLWRTHRRQFEQLCDKAGAFLLQHHGAGGSPEPTLVAEEPRWLQTLGESTLRDLAVDGPGALQVIEQIAEATLQEARDAYGVHHDEAHLKNVLLLALEEQLAGQMRGDSFPEEARQLFRELSDELTGGAPVLSDHSPEIGAAMAGWLLLFTEFLPEFVKPQWMHPPAEHEPVREETPREQTTRTWVEFKVVDDETGVGIPGVRLTVTLPDGNQSYHTTLGDGTIHIGNVVASGNATCSINEVMDSEAFEVVALE